MTGVQWADVQTQITAFLGDSLIAGGMKWIVGVSLGSFAAYMAINAFRK